MILAPGWFFRNVGPFGPRNDHYTRDNATMSIAFGAVGLTALRRPSWRNAASSSTCATCGRHWRQIRSRAVARDAKFLCKDF